MSYRRDLDLTIERDTIAAIGSAGPADNAGAVEIEGRGFAVLPGFVDIHAHPSSEPMLKGLTDEVGSRQLYMSSLYEYLPLFASCGSPSLSFSPRSPRRSPTARYAALRR